MNTTKQALPFESSDKSQEQVIKDALSFDAFSYAEEITGKSYKEDKITDDIGFLAHISHSKQKEEMLRELGDSSFHNNLEQYEKIIGDIGFKKILEIPFDNQYSAHDKVTHEKFFVYWYEECSILLTFDTYGENSVNGGKFYYNWIPNDIKDKNNPSSSGCYEGLSRFRDFFDFLGVKQNYKKFYWAGDYDCREAIKFHIEQLKKYGKFMKQWKKQPFLWLVHYVDTRNKTGEGLRNDNNTPTYDYKAINRTRLAMLPKSVQKAVRMRSEKQERREQLIGKKLRDFSCWCFRMRYCVEKKIGYHSYMKYFENNKFSRLLVKLGFKIKVYGVTGE